jgi:ribokinase
MNGKVLVVGSLNMDLVVNTAHLPQTGETILGGRFATIPGGKGANQAVAAARMGAPVSMIGCVGADGFGAELLRGAAQDGIDTRAITVETGAPTGIALITVDAEGRNTIVVASGANQLLSPLHLLAAKAAFSAAEVLVIQLEIPPETVGAALALAAEHGTRVVLNPAPARPLGAEILSQVDILIPNEVEALQMTGTATLEAAIETLLAQGVRNLILTLGEQGALLVSGGQRMHLPAYPVRAVDTVAAGDAFVGAFAAGLAGGLELEAAARLGNAAAALSVTRAGAQPSLPRRIEVDAFLQEQGDTPGLPR